MCSHQSIQLLFRYIDSSHTELLRIGNMNPDKGGTTIAQVYAAMEAITFPPLSVYPEYLKGGGGHSGDGNGDGVPSGDITLIVSIVDTYEDGGSKSSYEYFMDKLFNAMDSYGGGPCMDDHDTDPHVSMSRGVKFWSSYHQQQYMYSANLEVAVWQSMYTKGVVIGSTSTATFPPGRKGTRVSVGYGGLYFFFDRANITKAFQPNRDLYDSEKYYSTLYSSGSVSKYYSSTTNIKFDYGGSGDNGNYEWNPYSWNQLSAMHDMTDGWELPPNCLQEGETFFGIPLSRASGSKLQSSSTFQDMFDFEYLVDRNGTYIKDFGTNHGWLVGETLDNAVGSIVDKDTSHIPIFYTGTTNPEKVRLTSSVENRNLNSSHLDRSCCREECLYLTLLKWREKLILVPCISSQPLYSSTTMDTPNCNSKLTPNLPSRTCTTVCAKNLASRGTTSPRLMTLVCIQVVPCTPLVTVPSMAAVQTGTELVVSVRR